MRLASADGSAGEVDSIGSRRQAGEMEVHELPVEGASRWRVTEEDHQKILVLRAAFEERVISAYRLRDLPGKRSMLYQEWRKTYGDNTARESAKSTEALIQGKIPWPKWFNKKQF